MLEACYIIQLSVFLYKKKIVLYLRLCPSFFLLGCMFDLSVFDYLSVSSLFVVCRFFVCLSVVWLSVIGLFVVCLSLVCLLFVCLSVFIYVKYFAPTDTDSQFVLESLLLFKEPALVFVLEKVMMLLCNHCSKFTMHMGC